MTDIKHASLVLKTSDFTTRSDYVYGQPYSFANGSINGKMSTMSWNNINLRTVLGDMYDKYNTFNISLASISTSTAHAIDDDNESLYIVIKMAGLPWINQTYDSKLLTNGNKAVIAPLEFFRYDNTLRDFNGNCVSTFGKNQDVCNLTLQYFRVSDDVIPSDLFDVDLTNFAGTAGLLDDTIILDEAINNSFRIGSKITGAGIVANTVITEIISSTQIRISTQTIAALNATNLIIKPLYTYPNCVLIFDIVGISNDGDLPQRIPLK